MDSVITEDTIKKLTALRAVKPVKTHIAQCDSRKDNEQMCLRRRKDIFMKRRSDHRDSCTHVETVSPFVIMKIRGNPRNV